MGCKCWFRSTACSLIWIKYGFSIKHMRAIGHGETDADGVYVEVHKQSFSHHFGSLDTLYLSDRKAISPTADPGRDLWQSTVSAHDPR